jgi:hypothetical protein
MQEKRAPIGPGSEKTKTKATIKHGHRWGNWQFDEKRLYLDHIPTNYNISLHPRNLVVQIFHSVRQIRQKTWGSPPELHDLLRAYAEIFESNTKFRNAFQKGIVTRQDSWKAFCKDTAALINQPTLWSPEWNTKLEEIRKRFYGDKSKTEKRGTA